MNLVIGTVFIAVVILALYFLKKFILRKKGEWICSFHGSQGAKKVIFTACYSGKLKLAFTSPKVISTSPQNFHGSSVSWIPQNTSLSGKLRQWRTKFTSPIAQSTSPELSDTAFLSRWFYSVLVMSRVMLGLNALFFCDTQAQSKSKMQLLNFQNRGFVNGTRWSSTAKSIWERWELVNIPVRYTLRSVIIGW